VLHLVSFCIYVLSFSENVFFVDLFSILSLSLGVSLLNKGLPDIHNNLDWSEILENNFL
jgi:hypothetical protein